MSNKITKTFNFKVEKATESDDRSIGTIKGYASVFNSVDLVGDTIEKGAFSQSIKQYRKSKSMPPMLSGHSMDKVIGGFPILREDDIGLYVEGKVDLDTQRGREDFSLAKKGFLTGMSIGGYANDTVFTDKGRTIKNFKLMEVSLTPMPAEPKAQIQDVKAATSFKDYPIADDDTVWDKSKAISQIRSKTGSENEPSGSYRNGFMWYDSSDAKNFDSYKLPYVYVVDGQFKIIPKALSAIAGSLSGARGGLDIPEADKETIKSYIERYYKKMGKDSPFKDSSSDKELNIDHNCDSVKKASELDIRLSVMKLNNMIRRIKSDE